MPDANSLIRKFVAAKQRKMSSQSNTLPNENSPNCKLIAAKQTENVFTVKHLAKWELSDLQVDCCKTSGKCLYSQTPCQMRTLWFASWLQQKNNGKMSSQSNTSPDENSLERKYIQTSRAEQWPGHAVQCSTNICQGGSWINVPAMWVCLPKSLPLMWEGTPGEDICAHLGPVLMPFPTKLFAWVPVYPLYQARPGRIFIHPRHPTRWGPHILSTAAHTRSSRSNVSHKQNHVRVKIL